MVEETPLGEEGHGRAAEEKCVCWQGKLPPGFLTGTVKCVGKEETIAASKYWKKVWGCNARMYDPLYQELAPGPENQDITVSAERIWSIFFECLLQALEISWSALQIPQRTLSPPNQTLWRGGVQTLPVCKKKPNQNSMQRFSVWQGVIMLCYSMWSRALNSRGTCEVWTSHTEMRWKIKKTKNKNILVFVVLHSCLTHTLVWWWEQFPSLTYPRRRCFAVHLLLQRSFQIHPDWAASAASPSLFPNCLKLQLDFVQNKTFPSETRRKEKKKRKSCCLYSLIGKLLCIFKSNERIVVWFLFFFVTTAHWVKGSLPSYGFSDAAATILAGYQQVHRVDAITSQASVLECIFAALLENCWQRYLL